MNDQINTLFSDSYNQKQFFKNSILNSVIIYRYIIKDYFKYFLSSLSPLSRYEFWCFIFSLFISTVILSSLLFFVYTLFPAAKLFADIIFYSYVFFAFNVSVRAFACRIISVQMYLNNIKPAMKHRKAAFVENFVKKFFVNTKTYFVIAYINIFIILLYILHTIFAGYGLCMFPSDNVLFLNITKFLVFVVQMSAVMYVILLLLPSCNSLEYFMEKSIKYYTVFHCYNAFSKNYMVDYLTLSAALLSVISVGHLLIIGYTLSCHLIICSAILLQSIALMYSSKYFSLFIGIFNFIYCIAYMIIIFYNGVSDTFYDADKIMHILNYYQISIAMLFIGLFYHVTFDKDMIKMAAALGCFLAAIFLWEDYTAIKNIVVYDNHTIPVLFYGLVGLLTFFVYLVRVANYKGYYISETQIWNEYSHYVTQVTLKHIYITIFYASILLACYSFMFVILPALDNLLNVSIFDAYVLNFLHNIRKMLTFYMFLGLFLLFRCYQDMFSIFLITFVVICELYIIIYKALCNVFPLYMVYNVEYLYTAINAVLCVVSISLVKYSRIMAYGYSLAGVIFIISLINVFTHLSYQNTPALFYPFFVSLLAANIIVASGAYKKIKQYS